MKFRPRLRISTYGSLIGEPERMTLSLQYTSRIPAGFPGRFRPQGGTSQRLFPPATRKTWVTRGSVPPALKSTVAVA
jgi:hypothetical protein